MVAHEEQKTCKHHAIAFGRRKKAWQETYILVVSTRHEKCNTEIASENPKPVLSGACAMHVDD